MERRIAPSARIEADIEALLLDGHRPSPTGSASSAAWAPSSSSSAPSRTRSPPSWAGPATSARPTRTGSRNGSRPRRVQTAEGEIVIAMPQVRDTLTRFVSSVIPDMRGIVRTRPLEALVIGAYVRGLSDRDIESLAREAGLGSSAGPRSARSAGSCGTATGPSGPGASPRSACWRSSLTPSTCPSAPTAPGRASSWPGATRPTASGCSSTSASAQRERRGLAGPRSGPHPPGPAGPAAGRHRRGTRPGPGHRRAVARRRPPALLGPSPAQRPGQAARSDPGSRPGSGPPTGRRSTRRPTPAEAEHRPASPRRRARAGVPLGSGLSRRRPAGAHRPPRLPAPAADEAALDEPAGALARRGAAADQGHRALPRRDELPDARLGRHGPRHRRRHGLELNLPEHHAIAAIVAARSVPRTEQQVA